MGTGHIMQFDRDGPFITQGWLMTERKKGLLFLRKRWEQKQTHSKPGGDGCVSFVIIWKNAILQARVCVPLI